MESVHIHNRCHDARSEVEATVRVLAAQIRHYSSEHDDFLCTVAGLSDSGNTDRNWLDSSGDFYWHQGGAMFFLANMVGGSFGSFVRTPRGTSTGC